MSKELRCSCLKPVFKLCHYEKTLFMTDLFFYLYNKSKINRLIKYLSNSGFPYQFLFVIYFVVITEPQRKIQIILKNTLNIDLESLHFR